MNTTDELLLELSIESSSFININNDAAINFKIINSLCNMTVVLEIIRSNFTNVYSSALNSYISSDVASSIIIDVNEASISRVSSAVYYEISNIDETTLNLRNSKISDLQMYAVCTAKTGFRI